VPRPALEVADILRDHGAAWREANRGHVSLGQLKVMSAIERCRTAALGGHVARCENDGCGHTVIAYNSCRNRHCPKCQGAAAREWLAEREAELLPVPYFHVVYTLPAPIADIAYQNKAVIYDLLFKVSADTTLTIAADPRRLGARIAITSVLHTWGSAMTHHPHVHMIVPGGGLSPDGSRWIACRPNYLLPVEVLSALFRRRMLSSLRKAHKAGKLTFFGEHAGLTDGKAFAAFLRPWRKADWVVYAKQPFGGPSEVLRYLSRYTHRVAISNRRLIAADQRGITFKYKDYRLDGPARYKTMTLNPHEFIRRFLMHVLPKGLHRIRHYGLLANTNRAANIARARELLGAAQRLIEPKEDKAAALDEPRVSPCPRCAPGCEPKHRPSSTSPVFAIDTS
jgi:Putative transposase/Transposase zinc-binding domain